MSKIENRKEYKIILNKKQLAYFLKQNKSKLKRIYSSRVITSLYFDSTDFRLYKNSMNNDVNNYKVRVRTYSNNNSFFQEIKKNLSTGKSKVTKQLNINAFDDLKKIDINAVTLYPALFTEYNREYFVIENCRLTIDTSIKFKTHSFRRASNFEKFYSDIIMEFKLLNEDTNIEKYLFQNPVSFSKYNFAKKILYGD